MHTKAMTMSKTIGLYHLGEIGYKQNVVVIIIKKKLIIQHKNQTPWRIQTWADDPHSTDQK